MGTKHGPLEPLRINGVEYNCFTNDKDIRSAPNTVWNDCKKLVRDCPGYAYTILDKEQESSFISADKFDFDLGENPGQVTGVLAEISGCALALGTDPEGDIITDSIHLTNGASSSDSFGDTNADDPWGEEFGINWPVGGDGNTWGLTLQQSHVENPYFGVYFDLSNYTDRIKESGKHNDQRANNDDKYLVRIEWIRLTVWTSN